MVNFVDGLKHLQLATIDRKIVWSLILTTTKISKSMGHPIWRGYPVFSFDPSYLFWNLIQKVFSKILTRARKHRVGHKNKQYKKFVELQISCLSPISVKLLRSFFQLQFTKVCEAFHCRCFFRQLYIAKYKAELYGGFIFKT